MGGYGFSIVRDRMFFGMNTDLRIDPKSIHYRVRDRFVIYCQNNDLLHPKTMIYNVNDRNSLTPIIKFQQLNSELSHMKHFYEVSKSDFYHL